MRKIFPKTKMFDEAARQSNGHNFLIEIVIFIVVFFVTGIAASLPSLVYGIAGMLNDPDMLDLVSSYNAGEITFEQYNAEIAAFESSAPAMMIQLFATGISTLLTLAFCRFIEKRKVSTMGFRKKGFVLEYLVGMLVGTVMFSAAVGVCLLMGALRYDGVVSGIKWGVIAIFFVGFIIQGMSEEVTFRGYFMVSVSRKNHIAVAVALSSVAFGLAHLGNNGVTFLAVANIVLFGLFEALYILKRGGLWGVCGIHSLWNFVQGNFYGISVSGIMNMDSVLKMSSVESKTLINGGEFGLEGGLAVTVVLVTAIVIVSLTKTNKYEFFDEETAPVIEPAIAEE